MLAWTIVPVSPRFSFHEQHEELGKGRQKPYCDELTHHFWVEDKRERNNGTMNPYFLEAQKDPGKEKFWGERNSHLKMGQRV